MKIKSGSVLLFLAAILSTGFHKTLAQQAIALYPGAIPNSIAADNQETNKDQIARNVSRPTLTVFLPEKPNATRTAVIVCPGGGYGVLVMDREGYQVARQLNALGIAAFVLKYRLPEDKIMKNKSVGPLQDAQQAIKTVRERAAEWKIDPQKIGIMGFSAGGHLAATAGTHFDSTFIDNPQKTSLRPDFMILVYPVISMGGSMGHKGSAANLLGNAPAEKLVQYFSNELQVNTRTPTAFLTHAGDDTVVPVSNSLGFYDALQKNNVPADLHIYSKGEHGYLKTPQFGEWFEQCRLWMITNDLLAR
ncbi:alpha/beta hydrolase [Dyadobacter sandarakinus]|uniref:Alpha/beta hydrolase n=1 Tax=Dyadobacter sandarakinus TaxID=2747268 RepID=A0ABX7ICU0_9BACT|nr:alpha/beta hydrolase [Dyadobacter sandarakinus]QRR02736.1 alpha/beta hydrolase [Dyadobacter sandarakinus]